MIFREHSDIVEKDINFSRRLQIFVLQGLAGVYGQTEY